MPVYAFTNPNPAPGRPVDLHPLMQSLVETLANMKVEEDYELRKLQNSPAAPTVKGEIARRIRERGHQRQAPYRAALASLEDRLAMRPPPAVSDHRLIEAA